MSTIIAGIVVLVLFLWYRHYSEFKDFPPGPPKLPLIGSLLSIIGCHGSDIAVETAKIVPKYGDIIGYALGVLRLTIIHDFELAKEMFNSENYTGRVVCYYHSHHRGYNGKNIGIITTEGDTWRTHRRFALSTLKEFGFGKKSMGIIISEEAKELVTTLANSKNEVEIYQTFNIPVFNILWRIVGGKRYEHDDPHIKELQRIMGEVFKHAFMDRPFPWLSYYFPDLFHVNEKKGHCRSMKKMFEEVIKEHQDNLDQNSESLDLIDVYLKEMQTNPALNVQDLVGMCMDFFEAGGETVGSTMSWVVMYLAMHQDVQDKCYEEIVQVLGGREPTLDDRGSLPFCEATIMEIQRVSCVAAASLDHKPIKESWVGKYKLPENSYVFYNIYYFHNDPKYWGDPESFRPERFLEQVDGTTKILKHERLVPFGFGRRICMGESLAKAELFLFTVLLIQNAKILPSQFEELDPKKAVTGLTRCPQPYYVKMENRQD